MCPVFFWGITRKFFYMVDLAGMIFPPLSALSTHKASEHEAS